MAYYIPKGHRKFYYLPTCAAPATPTQAELTAGTLLSTAALFEVQGFSSKSSFVEIPSLATLQTAKIPGEKTSDDSSMQFYEDSAANPIKTTLAQDTTGYILLAPYGATTSTSKVDMFPIQVGSNSRTTTVGNEAAKFQIDFAITAVPTFDATMGS